ncbi:unnamed protein product, partial [Pleuronectes platessa]
SNTRAQSSDRTVGPWLDRLYVVGDVDDERVKEQVSWGWWLTWWCGWHLMRAVGGLELCGPFSCDHSTAPRTTRLHGQREQEESSRRRSREGAEEKPEGEPEESRRKPEESNREAQQLSMGRGQGFALPHIGACLPASRRSLAEREKKRGQKMKESSKMWGGNGVRRLRHTPL